MVQAKVVNYHLFNNERELCFVLYRKGRILALLCLVELVLNLAIAAIKAEGVDLSAPSAFEVTVHDEAHDAFMTLLLYTSGREGEAPQLSLGPKTRRLSICVRKCPPLPHGCSK